jgi:hypothetical protein
MHSLNQNSIQEGELTPVPRIMSTDTYGMQLMSAQDKMDPEVRAQIQSNFDRNIITLSADS